MCWSTQISLAFGLCHLLTAACVYYKKKSHYKDFLLFLGFYTLMEFFQAAQWVYGDIMPTSTFGYLNCSLTNTVFTSCAYALIWFQPILFAGITHISYRPFSSIVVLTAFWAMISLALGFWKTPTYLIPDSNYGLSTCTEIGPYGHLAWRFAPISVKYTPNDYVYVILIVVSIYESYYSRIKWTIGLGWLLTMIASIASVGSGSDLPAYWCMLSVFVDLPILYDIFLRNYFLQDTYSRLRKGWNHFEL